MSLFTEFCTEVNDKTQIIKKNQDLNSSVQYISLEYSYTIVSIPFDIYVP